MNKKITSLNFVSPGMVITLLTLNKSNACINQYHIITIHAKKYLILEILNSSHIMLNEDSLLL